MNHLYGKLNTPLTIKSYTGINTETANTTVDNQNNTIKVDVNTDNIATVDYVNEHIDTFTGEITLSGDEELVLQIQNGRLYHEGALYTGDITFSDEYIVGDVNGDGIVNQEDVEYLTFYTLFPDDYPLYPDDSACDFNKDGVVDDLDVKILSDYLSTHISEYPIGETSTRPIITLNVQEGFTYFEGNLYTDTVTLSGDATLYIVYEKGLVKNITTTNPSLDGTVKYDESQELTDGQKSTARDNIGAISAGEVSSLILESERSFGVYPLVFEEVEFESEHYLGLSKASYDRAVSARMYFYYIKGGSYYEDDGETGGYTESFIVPNVYPVIDGSSLSFTVVSSDEGAMPDVAFVQLGSGDNSVYILRPLLP